MYLHEEGIKDQKKKERSALMIMGLFLVLIAAFVWGTLKHKGFNTVYFACYILLFAAGVWASKLYLFLTPRRRYGTVKAIKDFRPTQLRVHGGANGTGATYNSVDVTEVTLVLDLDSGGTKEYVFLYRGDLKILKVGVRIGIFRFLRMPVWAKDEKH